MELLHSPAVMIGVRQAIFVCSLVGAAVCGGSSRVVAADSVTGTRTTLLSERAHEVELAMDDDQATLVVRRIVHNSGEQHDQAIFTIGVPHGGVATRLRVLGKHRGRPKWFEGKLLDVDAGSTRYQELRKSGGDSSMNAALLSWQWSSDPDPEPELALHLFAVEAGASETVEYTLAVPTHYEAGRYRISLPPMGTPERPARVVLRPTHRLDQLFVDGAPVAAGARIELDHEVEISLALRDPPLLQAKLAVHAFNEERALVEYEFQAAPKLSAIPDDAAIVVVIDTSKSLSDADVSASIAAARAYLGHFAAPELRAKAEVVTFARSPARRHGAMVDVAQVMADLETLVPVRKNGSSVDAALEQTLDILAKAPRKAPRRVVLFTDTLTRASLTTVRLRTLAKRSGALIHILDIGAARANDDDPAWISRHDEHAWSAVARATGGLVWFGNASNDEGTMHVALEELARPLRIDGLRVRLGGMPSEDSRLPESLEEGSGVAIIEVDKAARLLQVDGELWSRPIRKAVKASKAPGRLWSGLVSGTDVLHELDDREMLQLALQGGVVSPMTSYLAITPGIPPSADGFELGPELALWYAGVWGRSSCGPFIGEPPVRTDFSAQIRPWLEQRLQEAADRCGAPTSKAMATIETTKSEVVDVHSVSLDPRDARAEHCLREELWTLELPSEFVAAFTAWTVQTHP